MLNDELLIIKLVTIFFTPELITLLISALSFLTGVTVFAPTFCPLRT